MRSRTELYFGITSLEIRLYIVVTVKIIKVNEIEMMNKITTYNRK